MKTNKILKVLSIIFECSTFGSLILYIYNYFNATKKYDVIPKEVKGTLNIFLIIAIVSFIIFLVLKYVLYLRNNKKDKNVQLEMDLDNYDNYVNSNYNAPLSMEKIKDLEAPVNERVFIYKDEYEIPDDRKMHCPNCNSVIDKNACICVKCGYLIKNIIQEKVVERIVEKPVEKIVEKIVEKPVEKIVEKKVYNDYKYNDNYDYGSSYESYYEPVYHTRTRRTKKSSLKDLYINLLLIICIVVFVICIILMAQNRGIFI